MSLTERLYLILGGLVSMLGLMGAVWYSAIAVNNMSRDIRDQSLRMGSIETIMRKTQDANSQLRDQYSILLSNQNRLLKRTPLLIDITANYALFGTDDGRRVRLQIYKADSVGNK